MRYPAANDLSRILEELDGFSAARPPGMTDSPDDPGFPKAPGIVGPRSQLSPRRCSTVQAFLRPYEEISTTVVQRFQAWKNTVRRGLVERNSLPNSILTDRVNSSLYSFGGLGRGKLFRINAED